MNMVKKNLDFASASAKIWVQKQGYGLSFWVNHRFFTGIGGRKHKNCGRCFGIMPKNARLGDKDVLGFLHIISPARWILMVDREENIGECDFLRNEMQEHLKVKILYQFVGEAKQVVAQCSCYESNYA